MRCMVFFYSTAVLVFEKIPNTSSLYASEACCPRKQLGIGNYACALLAVVRLVLEIFSSTKVFENFSDASLFLKRGLTYVSKPSLCVFRYALP